MYDVWIAPLFIVGTLWGRHTSDKIVVIITLSNPSYMICVGIRGYCVLTLYMAIGGISFHTLLGLGSLLPRKRNIIRFTSYYC